jgi:CheY-like chemotaxis protein
MEMARLDSARKMLDAVFTLDPANKTASSLLQAVQGRLGEIEHRRNGGGRNGHRSKREELILVVDQDERLLHSMTATLCRYGFHIIAAASVEEAIEVLSHAKPDLIVSEVNFENGARGVELYDHVRGMAVSIPFMFLAARIDRDFLIAGKRLGVDDLLQKPVDDEVVAAAITSCLTRKKNGHTPSS